MAHAKKAGRGTAPTKTASKSPAKTKKPRRVHDFLVGHGLKKKWQRILAYTGVILVFFISLHLTLEWLIPQVKNPKYGVSFSIKYAKELGNDWQANYLALLDDMQFKHLRLMSYWDSIEPQKGQYDFTDLDWQFNEAAKRGAKVSLAIGLRQPRWPECHEPEWAKALPMEGPQWQSDLSKYIEVVVKRYKTHPALESYQLENESLNTWFGDCRSRAANRDRLVAEYNMVKKLDPNHPLLMSLSDEHGFPMRQPVPDEYGFSIYRIVWNDKTPVHFYLTYPAPVWWHRLRAGVIKLTQHRNVYVHELQVEPWGPKPTVELSVPDQDRSMGVKQIHKNMVFGRKIGSQEIYTWGGEWWYWRKVHFNDPGPWNAVKQEIGTSTTE